MNAEPPKTNGLGGLGGLLTTLASSGDNWVKMLIVGGLILNTFLAKDNGNGIRNNKREVDRLGRNVALQVKAIYKNQRIWGNYMNESRADHDLVMEKLGIAIRRNGPLPTPNPADYNEEDEP